MLIYEEERIFSKALDLKQSEKTELTTSCANSFVITKNFILRFTCDKAVLCSAEEEMPILKFSPHKRNNGEISHSIPPSYTDWITLSE